MYQETIHILIAVKHDNYIMEYQVSCSKVLSYRFISFWLQESQNCTFFYGKQEYLKKKWKVYQELGSIITMSFLQYGSKEVFGSSWRRNVNIVNQFLPEV